MAALCRDAGIALLTSADHLHANRLARTTSKRSFVYTPCTAICPVTRRCLHKVQQPDRHQVLYLKWLSCAISFSFRRVFGTQTLPAGVHTRCAAGAGQRRCLGQPGGGAPAEPLVGPRLFRCFRGATDTSLLRLLGLVGPEPSWQWASGIIGAGALSSLPCGGSNPPMHRAPASAVDQAFADGFARVFEPAAEAHQCKRPCIKPAEQNICTCVSTTLIASCDDIACSPTRSKFAACGQCCCRYSGRVCSLCAVFACLHSLSKDGPWHGNVTRLRQAFRPLCAHPEASAAGLVLTQETRCFTMGPVAFKVPVPAPPSSLEASRLRCSRALHKPKVCQHYAAVSLLFHLEGQTCQNAGVCTLRVFAARIQRRCCWDLGLATCCRTATPQALKFARTSYRGFGCTCLCRRPSSTRRIVPVIVRDVQSLK